MHTNIKEVGKLLKADNIKFEYATKEVLRGISLTVNLGDRIGLIGPNGSGKSTLLRILAGELKPSKGLVIASGLLIGYMPQDPTEGLELDVIDFIKKLTGVLDAETDFDAATKAACEKPDSMARLEDAMSKMEHLGAYDFESRLSKVAKRTGLTEGLLNQTAKSLSGGQRKRVLLTAVLLSRFDILLLDEPTNDLDLQGIELLERFIRTSKSAFVIVTHDRRMLRSITTKIAELSPEGDAIELYSLGYEEYLSARETKRRSVEQAYERYLEEKKRLKEASQRLAIESRRAESSKNTSDNEKLAFHSTREKAATSYSSSARAVAGRMEQLEEPPRPQKDLDLSFAFKSGRSHASNVLVELKRVVLNYPGFSFGPVDLEVNRGERIVITGSNGSGKTTLLRILAGQQNLESGNLHYGKGVKIGMVDQNKTLPLLNGNVLENAKEMTTKNDELFDEPHARSVLDRFNFNAEKLDQSGISLSPGERARLLLAMLVVKETNFLLMDEPTNHLDIPAMEELEKALTTYPETFVVVSHDREFITAIKPTRILEVINGRLK